MLELIKKLAELADQLDQLEAPDLADEVDTLLRELQEDAAKLAKEEESYMTICDKCEGSGESENSPWCEKCKGSGFVKGASTNSSLVKLSYVRKRGKKWCVFSKKNKKLGCHPTRAAALRQLRAIEANK